MKLNHMFMVLGVLCVMGGVSSAHAEVVLYAEGKLIRDDSTPPKGKVAGRHVMREQHYELDIKVVNFADTVEEYAVAWYFIEREVDEEGKKRKPVLVKGGQRSLMIPAGEAKKFELTSYTLKTEKVVTVDKKKKAKVTYEGAEFENFIVVVRQDGKILKKAAGSRKYLSEKWLKQLPLAAPKK